MKTKVYVLLAVLFALVAPSASAKTVRVDGDAEFTQIGKLERAMWEAWRTHDLAALEALTSPDYVTVNEFGQSTWAEVKAAFGDFALASYTLGELRPVRVSRDVVVVSYSADIHGAYKGTDVSRRVAECSVWRREKTGWRNVYLHEITVK